MRASGIWSDRDLDGDDETGILHVYPNYGREHVLILNDPPGDCWCSPTIEDYRAQGGSMLVIHREEN